MSDLRKSLNPCIINLLPANHADLEREIKYEDVLKRKNSAGLTYENAKLFYTQYNAIQDLLKKHKLAKYGQYLTYTLQPIFSNEPAGLNDSKIGGIADLRHCLYILSAIGKKLNISDVLTRVWPKCGCCHEPMKFLAQIDLHNWLLPIWSATNFDMDGDGYWPVAGIGNKRMVEHQGIFDQRLWVFFVCAEASGHFDNPGYDSHLMICSTRESERREITEEQWLEAYKEAGFGEDSALQHAPQLGKKISGLELRFGFDGPSMAYKAQSRLEKIEKDNPGLFSDYGDGYKLFGEPRCQQQPKRFWANTGSVARRLTPTLNYDDSEADMTYQLYFDLMRSDGYAAFGKCDSSCT